jgi:aryl-alcohol dehydrogenase-like predicted oxidoreductase
MWMKTTVSGRSGLRVSRIALGTWQVQVAIIGARHALHVEDSLAADSVTGPSPESV